MPERPCSHCGRVNPTDSRFCAQCGASDREAEPHPWHAFFTRPADKTPSDAVYLSMGRVLGFTAVTLGLYLAYWLYATWKHLASETEDAHYPLWHTLAILFVPIYGLFRLHRHVALVAKLARAQGVDTTLSPLLAVLVWFLSSVLQFLTLGMEDPGTALALTFFALGLLVAFLVWAQMPLNDYWQRVRSRLAAPPLAVFEVILLALGVFSWLSLLLQA